MRRSRHTGQRYRRERESWRWNSCRLVHLLQLELKHLCLAALLLKNGLKALPSTLLSLFGPNLCSHEGLC